MRYKSSNNFMKIGWDVRKTGGKRGYWRKTGGNYLKSKAITLLIRYFSNLTNQVELDVFR